MSVEQFKTNYDVVIVGAGFAGMYQLHKARELGFSAVVIDGNAEVGGCGTVRLSADGQAEAHT
ncbi:hypothetical protein EKN06_10215 [Croceicoccus ponticola]|uniref:FAD-binding protein n=1 Tax=Croceicoccus ponticola TaxID=2217664 RepID=A0A437GWB1_9SPHN|nr:NAD(P)-binding protein [Croceicoccus ponticola]RVQ66395.1 hypothetical protein EKN06_10215 [Croceicoccus ponticola]